MKFLGTMSLRATILDGQLIMHLDLKKSLLKLLQDLNRVRLPLSWPIWRKKDDGGTFTNKVYVAGNGIHVEKYQPWSGHLEVCMICERKWFNNG